MTMEQEAQRAVQEALCRVLARKHPGSVWVPDDQKPSPNAVVVTLGHHFPEAPETEG